MILLTLKNPAKCHVGRYEASCFGAIHTVDLVFEVRVHPSQTIPHAFVSSYHFVLNNKRRAAGTKTKRNNKTQAIRHLPFEGLSPPPQPESRKTPAIASAAAGRPNSHHHGKRPKALPTMMKKKIVSHFAAAWSSAVDAVFLLLLRWWLRCDGPRVRRSEVGDRRD